MKAIFTLICLLGFAVVYAQEIIISGNVSDVNGPLANCTISIKDTKNTTVTDLSGNYKLKVHASGNFTLKTSATGYKQQERIISIGDKEEVNWLLEKDLRTLDEVVISSSRRPESLNNIPSSITVVTQKTIEGNLALSSDLTEILAKEVPGLAPSAQTSSNVGQTLRGRSVLIMIDGVPQSTPLRNGEVDLRSIDPAVIERVEVIKGATAIYGNGAAGGLINYITKKSMEKKPIAGQTSVNLTGSLVNPKHSGGGRVSQQLYGQSGKWDYMVSGMYEQTGEFKDAEGDVLSPNYSLGETDTYNAFTKVGFAPAANQRVQLTYNLYSSLQNTNYTLVNGDFITDQKATGVLGKPTGEPTGAKYNHNIHFAYTADSLIGRTSFIADAYYESRKDIFYVSLGRFDGGDGQSLTHSKKKGLRALFNTPLVDTKKITGSITYGADLLNDITSQPLVDGRTWVPEMDMLNLAPFAQTDFTVWQSLVVKAGARVERVNIKVNDYTTLRITDSQGNTLTPSFDVKGGNLSYTTPLFNAGIRFNKFALFIPYASFSQGFSVADIGSALRDAKVDHVNKINTEAVKVNNYEVGFVSKYGLFRLELTGFISTSKLGTEVVFDNVTGLFNVSRSPERIYGYEAVINYNPFHNLELSASYSYTEGKRDLDNDGSFKEDAYLNGRRIAAPKFTGAVTYRPIDLLELRLQYMGLGSRDRFEKNDKGIYNGNEGKVNAYNLINLSGTYRLTGNANLSLGIENLFNEDYYPARSQWFMIPSFYAKGKGRSVNLGLSINF